MKWDKLSHPSFLTISFPFFQSVRYEFNKSTTKLQAHQRRKVSMMNKCNDYLTRENDFEPSSLHVKQKKYTNNMMNH